MNFNNKKSNNTHIEVELIKRYQHCTNTAQKRQMKIARCQQYCDQTRKQYRQLPTNQHLNDNKQHTKHTYEVSSIEQSRYKSK